MNGLRWLALAAALAAPAVAAAQAGKVEKLSDHAYAYLTGAGNYNSGFIVTDEGILVVDTQDTVIHAEEFVAEIRKVSNKPILYAVNTNFHYAHVTGNQLFLKDVKAIIATEPTRKNMMELGQDELASMKQKYALDIEQLETSLRDDPLSDQERAQTEAMLTDARKSLTALDRTQLTPANLTLTSQTLHFYPAGPLKHELLYDAVPGLLSETGRVPQDARMRLTLGGLEIQVLYLGRGHTNGDLLVYVPSEKVLYTGGLLFAQTLPWLRGSFIADWQQTLDQALKLEVEKIVPGTGELATRDDLIAFKGYLTDLYSAVKNQLDQGVPKDDVRWKVDLSAYQNWTNYENYLRYNIEDAYDEIEAARTGGAGGGP